MDSNSCSSYWLRYYALVFDYVEVDSSFYRMPERQFTGKALISILTIAIYTSILQSALTVSLKKDDQCCVPVLLAPIAASGSNIYTAWTNATPSTLHSTPVFFTKSNDGGKTFAHIIMLNSTSGGTNK